MNLQVDSISIIALKSITIDKNHSSILYSYKVYSSQLTAAKSYTTLAGVLMGLDSFTTQEWEQKIGDQTRSLRLRLNLQQSAVADQAGISLTALKNLESGKGATMKTFIKVLRVYGREEWLNTISPQITISPLQMLNKKTERQRARGKKVTNGV